MIHAFHQCSWLIQTTSLVMVAQLAKHCHLEKHKLHNPIKRRKLWSFLPPIMQSKSWTSISAFHARSTPISVMAWSMLQNAKKWDRMKYISKLQIGPLTIKSTNRWYWVLMIVSIAISLLEKLMGGWLVFKGSRSGQRLEWPEKSLLLIEMVMVVKYPMKCPYWLEINRNI